MSDPMPSDRFADAEPSLEALGQALFSAAAAPDGRSAGSWLPPTTRELQALLPQYEILDMIGCGGMGAVYLASQSALDRLVAIKILSTELDAQHPGFSVRFKNEARAMAKLSHPCIVAIYDFGETDTGLHYIVMEFVEGTNVQQMINASRRLHTEHALAITAHVCDALHYAHERGIIHRDIKPANIIVGYDGSVKVADFGLAKVGALSGETRHLTRSGTALGTPHYIAPEALAPGAQTDLRADIYAAGVMLYHMLTGKLPQGIFELPSIQVPGLDPRLDAIIARAMREDPGQRYLTAAEMRAAIDGILTQPIPHSGPDAALPTEARPQRPGEKVSSAIHSRISTKAPFSFWAWAAALAALGVAIWLYQGNGQPRSGMQDVFAPVGEPASSPAERTSTTSVFPAATATDWLAGRWHQTFGDSDLPIYLVELDADHSARFAGGSLHTTGHWKLENDALEISWSNGARYHLEVPGNRPSTDLRGMIFNMDNTSGKKVPLRLQKAGEENMPAGGLSGPLAPPSSNAIPLGAREPADATKDQPFTNSLGMQFVPVPGTQVLFCIHETRHSDYSAFAREVAGVDDSWKERLIGGFSITEREENHPVRRVCWEDAQMFCTWLSRKEGRLYRLPTDKEWSLAVGIGHTEEWAEDTTPDTVFKDPDLFPWGSEWPPPPGAGNFSDESLKTETALSASGYIEDYDDGFPATAPVMSFTPNAFGLHDMSGNVWEMVQDWFDTTQRHRATRGGSCFIHEREKLLASYRSSIIPSSRVNGLGFRLVLEGLESPEPSPAEARKSPPEDRSESTLTTTKPLPQATRDQPFTNSLGMQFVPVPGTDTLFCIHETRCRDFVAYAAENPQAVAAWPTKERLQLSADALREHPAVYMTAYDARAFCAWLSRRENRLYRLPTDREWSLAVGIGENEDWGPSTTPTSVNRVEDAYPWGTEWPPPPGAGNYSDTSRAETAPPDMQGAVTGGYSDGFPGTAPVMSFPPNKLGLYDMGGNVWEFVEDWSSHSKDRHVARGASYTSYARGSLLASMRGFLLPDSRMPDKGFRIVLAASAAAKPVPPAAVEPDKEEAFSTQSTSVPFVNSLRMAFVPVPGTRVLFSIYETRWKDYAAFAAETPRLDPSWKDQSYNGIPVTGPAQDHPVIRVSWLEAVQFCQWLTGKERAQGRIDPQDGYRLPTDAEWSHAAGIGSLETAGLLPAAKSQKVETYPWPGGRYPPGPGSGNFADRSAMRAGSSGHNAKKYFQHFDDGYPTTAPVGKFQPNAFGIFDLAGNVGEWCQDWYDEEQRHHVMRGSSWIDGDTSLHTLTSWRTRQQPHWRSPYFGFRIVLERGATSPPQEEDRR